MMSTLAGSSSSRASRVVSLLEQAAAFASGAALVKLFTMEIEVAYGDAPDRELCHAVARPPLLERASVVAMSERVVVAAVGAPAPQSPLSPACG